MLRAGFFFLRLHHHRQIPQHKTTYPQKVLKKISSMPHPRLTNHPCFASKTKTQFIHSITMSSSLFPKFFSQTDTAVVRSWPFHLLSLRCGGPLEKRGGAGGSGFVRLGSGDVPSHFHCDVLPWPAAASAVPR